MVLPIVAYGDPVLKKIAEEIDQNYPGLEELIKNMFDTMYKAKGVGLAAPQIGKSIRLFVVDCSPFADDEDDDEPLDPKEKENLKSFIKVFINPQIIEEKGEEWAFNEGCLSIPKIREDVYRQPVITIKYLDEKFMPHTETIGGMPARVIQHEYDHIEGILFTDHLSAIRKRLLKGKLTDISKGKVSVDYKMKFPVKA